MEVDKRYRNRMTEDGNDERGWKRMYEDTKRGWKTMIEEERRWKRIKEDEREKR